MAIGTLFGGSAESIGLYGNSAGNSVNPTVVNQTYFEWFIFTTSAGTPTTPTGGTWDFTSNTGTAPTGWSSFISGVPLNSLWFSVAFIDSRNPSATIVWSAPGLISSQSIYATAYVDVFTGNGSTTAWTLSQDPVVVNNTDVSINGVTQIPGTDYTLSSTTLTTTTAAPLNAKILVKYRQALPLSYYGAASNVQFTPVGTLTSTNVQAAIAEVLTDYALQTGAASIGFTPVGALSSTNVQSAIAEVVTDLALSSGSSTVGYTQGGTGAVATTVQAKLRQTVSVKDFGAKGDGVTNDQPAIQAAIAYAQTFSVRTIYFPIGNYYVTSGIVFTTNVGIDCDSSTIITASANTFPVVTLAPSNYSNAVLNIPSIVGGSIGLYLYGTALAKINIANIANSVDGLVLALDNTNKTCADNVINFTVINGCSGSAIKFAYNATTTSGTLMQGNQIKGNFIVSCKYGTQFYDVNNGSLTNLPWDDTEVDVFAVDLANIAGSICIYGNPSLPPARSTFKHRGFFGAADIYIKGSANNNFFQLAFPSPPEYAKMQLTGGGNRIIECSAGWQTFVPPYPEMTTTYNTISTFNSGSPLQSNRVIMQFTLATTLATNTTKSFWFYHPLMTQYRPKVTYEVLWDMGFTPMIVAFCNETSTPGLASNPYPFQGTIELYAIAAVSAGTYLIAITVHDAPQ